jgi:Heavy metal associated domain 2
MDAPAIQAILVAHEVPGRLRLQVPALAGNKRHAASLRDHLEGVPGVLSAKPNLTTGSLVVEYAVDTANRDMILAQLRQCRLPAPEQAAPQEGASERGASKRGARRQPEPPPLVATLSERFAHMLAEYLVERVATAFVAAII